MRWAPWALLGVLVIGVVAWAAWPDSGSRTVHQRVQDLASELRCPDCEGLSVADSSSSSARAIRADVERRIRAGEDDEEIRQAYVDRFGESILLNPEGGGLGVIVWGLPVLVLVVGAGGIALALRRWRREPVMHATAADEALVREVRATEHEDSEAP
jgi:cytochrome c-type biogenesis protein CcmH